MNEACGLSTDARLEVERRSSEFESAWQAGATPSLERFLEDFPGKGAEREALFTRLLTIEVHIRNSHGDCPDFRSYLDRFPDYGGSIANILNTYCGTGTWPCEELQTSSNSDLAGQPALLIRDPNDRDLPATLGKYRILCRLGEGKFGVVYLAWHPELHRQVAIKYPHIDSSDDRKEVERIVLEARRIANLKHPAIVGVYDVEMNGERPFIVQEFIDGSDLRQACKAQSFAPGRTCELIADVADAVAHAHENGIFHRDLKPGNILLDSAGRPYVADFGLAIDFDSRSERRGERSGTPRYMSPEQVRGESHRLDGRTDIWSLGVILYEMLAGVPPFTGPTIPDVFDEILHGELRPLRQIRPQLSAELERICQRCLSRRISDRYGTARDLAADLRAAATAAAVPVPASPGPTAPMIIPKGLRCYDEQDAEAYLELLPGPYDRDGLPVSVRDWKLRIEETDADRTFSIGVLYGPSGSGKSSMVRAGLVPRLRPQVLPIYVEATADDIELRIRRALEKKIPAIPPEMPLPDVFAGLRHRAWPISARKVVLIIDQFEQWLHRGRQYDRSVLLDALRQCDGEHLQAIVLVRDDFWMGTTQFLRELEATRSYSAAFDRFSLRHARDVLVKLGQAYGALPKTHAEITAEQAAFLDQAIGDLEQDDRIISVHLSIFAEMLKDKPWLPSTLKHVGGSRGVGEAFLTSAFSSVAPPKQRYYARAAERVLQELLPEPGVDIKGHTRSRTQLQIAADLVDRSPEFMELLSILDTELHLITPVEPHSEEGRPTARQDQQYQLTHDYLIPSLRNWIHRRQSQTIAGKATLRLADRSALWSSVPEKKQLPSLPEWCFIRSFTRRRNWTSKQTEMMRAADRHHLTRILAVTVLLGCATASLWGWESRRRRNDEAQRVGGLVRQLWNVDLLHFPEVADQLRASPGGWQQPVQEVADDRQQSVDRQTRAHLALAWDSPRSAGFLQDRLLTADLEEYGLIARELERWKDRCVPAFWRVVNETRPPAEVLRAAGYLAQYDAQGESWEGVAKPVVGALLAANPLELQHWVARLRPVSRKLMPHLLAAFRNSPPPDKERNAEGVDEARRQMALVAANVLADYTERDETLLPAGSLIDLALEADAGQFEILFGRLLKLDRSALIGHLVDRVQAPPAGQELEDERRVSQRANAGEALLRLRQLEPIRPLLETKPDPRLRTALIDRLFRAPLDWLREIEKAADPAIRQALILGLDQARREWKPDEAKRFRQLLLERYVEDPDPGVHSATEWLLGRMGHDEAVLKIRDEVLAGRDVPGRRWFVNRHGHTLMITAMSHDAGNPQQALVEAGGGAAIGYRFAIAAHEVTVEQYLAFNRDFEFDERISPEPRCPINGINWYDAVKYCRWLSEQEGIPEHEMCYPPIEDIGATMSLPADMHRRKGYRLPTTLEWQSAVRDGSITTRFYGNSDALLRRYAWFAANSDAHTWPVGRVIPNALGLFDVYGNLREWSHPPPPEQDPQYLCGGGYREVPTLAKSAHLAPATKDQRLSITGFRLTKAMD